MTDPARLPYVSIVPRARNAPPNYYPHEITIDLPVLRALTHLKQEHAARHLGISLTSFKSACRRLGIARWPYNKRRTAQQSPQQDEASEPRRETTSNEDSSNKALKLPEEDHSEVLEEEEASANADRDSNSDTMMAEGDGSMEEEGAEVVEALVQPEHVEEGPGMDEDWMSWYLRVEGESIDSGEEAMQTWM
ncbi:hypothetical protein GUITHDRAFT_122838 [Guillardia theta CCMP2712]|uniref:RWP-RK domain-containing protein n=1 Tax=Guillardia theta (strain CCMP2712) TaxID=905079 RepID=L1I527_GUITC|nr:hypothetical protein GUITHDRAFT_122838 [Guillardia theta CCMP2712]EKX30955.1 hypothetical protein GUITHDRAFT_122838 [Guillardia theta CCMP2712]|eukprot:XP_005817935.1 hypothetical protein GUITHDRAFT_122838 [Guillardia theta CCMP2712]